MTGRAGRWWPDPGLPSGPLHRGAGRCRGVEAEVVRLFEEMDARLGPVTHLVNNAGRLQPQMRVLEMSAERISQTLTTNVTSCFLCCRRRVRRMTAGAPSSMSPRPQPGWVRRGVRGLCRRQGAVDVLTRAVAGAGGQDPGQQGASGFIYTDMHADGGSPVGSTG